MKASMNLRDNESALFSEKCSANIMRSMRKSIKDKAMAKAA